MSVYFFFVAACIILGTLLSPLHFCLTVTLLVVLAFAILKIQTFKNFLPWHKILIAVIAISFGFAWLQWQLLHRLPVDLDKQQVNLKLHVIESRGKADLQRLLVKVASSPAEIEAQGVPHLRYLQLSLYKFKAIIQPGSLIDAELVLRSPRNIANGLAFDYEAWLISKGVDATGYIRRIDNVSEATTPLRQQVIKQQQTRHTVPAWAWIAGLVFGEQDSFTPEQWQLAKQTGTLHLLVVSGLHMALVLLLLVALWKTILRLVSFCLGRSLPNLMLWQLLFLLVGSAGYLWLAGSGVALQRAWLMFALVLGLQSTRLKLNWLTAISFAMLLVVINNPLIWTGPGFSYSFSAVFALLLFFTARQSNLVEAVYLPQWVVFISLLPLFLWWQQPVSIMQCFANLIAIPYVSFVLLPLSLINLALPYAPVAALLEQAGDIFWWFLQELSLLPTPYITYIPLVSLLLWPIWLVLVRRGVSYSLTLLLSLLVMSAYFLFPAAQKPVAMMVDVGQGQSLVFTTKEHTVVYDTGPFMGQFDTGEAVVTPVLYKLGVKKIDNLIISHDDNDHAGGTGALLNNFPVDELSGGQVLKALSNRINLCRHSTERWQVLSNSMLLRYLNVDEESWARFADSNNNRSCVVQLQWYGTRFLLTGDIGTGVEYDLIRKYGQDLASDILVLAHHGSNTSSSGVFLRTVAPQQVWISAGFNNKFGHPTEAVLQRLKQQNIPWLNTAEEGAIVLHPSGIIISARDNWQPPWRQPK